MNVAQACSVLRVVPLVLFASFAGSLQTRPTPDSVHALIAGRARVVFVGNVLQSVPEEKWLRANGMVSRDIRVGSYRIIDFRPISSQTF
jgi:hypothetical protein